MSFLLSHPSEVAFILISTLSSLPGSHAGPGMGKLVTI